jgi:polysaccharide export outer membrane protein
MTSAAFRGVLLLAAICVGCTTSGSGGVILFPKPYKLLEETKALKAAHPNPVVWPRELSKNVTGPAVAEPGDLLAIAAVDPAMRAPFVGEQPILLDGTVDLAKYGRVVVGYKTLSEVEAIINASIKNQGARDLAVTVRFARAPDSKRVYVLGDVVTPGSYPINGNETVLDAILLAGGLTRKADERNIILSRPTPVCDCRVVVPICHEEIVQWGDSSTNYQLLPGDRIYVPSLSLFHRIFGRKNDRCPPCGGYPSPCPLPEEKCDIGCGKAVGVGPAELALPSMTTPVGPGLTPTPPSPAGAPPLTAPKLEERRLPPPTSLRDTPRGATAIPVTRSPAGADFDPPPRVSLDRSKTSLLEPSVKQMGTMSPSRSTSAASATTKESPALDWQSPWRPASLRTTP